MKRSLYKRLHRTLHPHLGRADTAQVATAVMVVPDAAVPAGHPARDWMEMATARMWAKPTADGLLVAVRTYGRDADGYTANDEVLATGLVRDLYGSLADKRHRIYHHAETGTLCTELIEPDHPAERYRAYWLEFTARFEQTVEQARTRWTSRSGSGP